MKILLTGAYCYTEPQLAKLRGLGLECIMMPDERGDLPEGAADAEITVCNNLFLYHELSVFPRLRCVQLTSAGLDRVPVAKLQEKGIMLYNARGVYSVPMAEFALWGVLSLYKQANFFYNNQKAHVWEKHRGLLELSGGRVCIVGCGSVGQACADCFHALHMQVTGVDLVEPKSDSFDRYCPVTQIGQAVRDADVVILTVPLTNETKHLISKKTLERFKHGAVLVNVARGGVVDTLALVDALQNGILGGAVLDVFEEEPLPSDSPLWDMPNVLVTPHNSFVSQNNKDRLFSVIYQNLCMFLKGETDR